jgi:hypothetical protein
VSALLSECGLYRHRLERQIADAGPVFVFIGVNPSTATADVEDQTTMKWRGFVSRWGGSRYIAVNLFDYRATDVNELARVERPRSAASDDALRAAIAAGDQVVPCWGDRGKLPPRLRPRVETVKTILRECGKPVRVLGLTKGGDPKHPLMLGYSTELQDWTP